MLRVFPVIFNQTIDGHLLQNIVQILFVAAREPYHVLHCAGFTFAHLHGYLSHLIGTDSA